MLFGEASSLKMFGEKRTCFKAVKILSRFDQVDSEKISN